MKRNIICQILIAVLLVASMTTVAFAYYFEKDSGWGQEINATAISFKVNGVGINQISESAPVKLHKGGEAELKFDVTVTASTNVKSLARYSLNFSIAEGNAKQNELARAIEVYKYSNGEYKYVSMLDSFTVINGLMPINSTDTHVYKLIYSSSAGEYYEGKTFKLDMKAESEMVFEEEERHFVSTYSQFLNAIRENELKKGQILTLNNDIAIANDATNPANNALVLASQVGLDFNGHTLTLADGVSLTIKHDGASGKGLGVFNRVPSRGGATGGGKIYIDTPDDCLFIQDDLNAETLQKIEIINYSYDVAIAAMQKEAALVEGRILIAGDSIDFAKNLHKYFGLEDSAQKLSYQMSTEDSKIASYNSTATPENPITGFYINNTFSSPITIIKPVDIQISKVDKTTILHLPLTIRGDSADSIADYYLNTIPSTINSSLFLPTYDSKTKATITWVTGNSALLSANGSYLAEGYESLASWKDQQISIGIIIDKAGERSEGQKNVIIEVLNAKQRTELIYSYKQMIMEKVDATINFFDSFVDVTMAGRACLNDIVITIAEDGSNDLNSEKKLLEIIRNNGYDDIKLINKPTIDKSQKVNISVTFKYGNLGAEQIEYTVSKTVTVIGEKATSDLSDLTPILQKDFDNNDYINFANVYEFTVKAYTPQGANMDYFVSDAYRDAILIENDFYSVRTSGSGHFVMLEEGVYRYFANRYNKVAGGYETAEDGDWILIDDTAYSYSEYQQNGKIFERETRIKVLPGAVPCEDILVPFTAQVWETKDANGNKIYLTSGGEKLKYKLSLALRGIYHNTAAEIEDFTFYKKLVEYFDLNGNGWIEVTEAETDWNTIQTGIAQGIYNTKAFSTSGATLYADFRDAKLTSLKGLEYFTGAVGLDFTTNNLTDISILSTVYNLEYLNLYGNNIADIGGLQYLDKLEVLNLGANHITDITPLQYLPNISNLNLAHNVDLADFSALINYKNLEILDIQQLGNPHTDTSHIMYILALVCDNNPGVKISRLYNTDYQNPIPPWTASTTQIVAAKALSELLVVDEVYTTLNIPNTYYYEYYINNVKYSDTYSLKWQTVNATDRQFITFIEDANGATIGYQINSPTVKKEIQIAVEVKKDIGVGTVQLARPFYINLLAGQGASSAVYIETAIGNYQDANVVIKDDKLRSLLFDTFNRIVDGTVNIDGNSHSNKNVLSYEEITTQISSSYDFRDRGITDLAGLRYFAGALKGATLMLQGNKLAGADISELSHLNGLIGLELSGQLYDYTQLVPEAGGADRLTSLTRLTVFGSYGLDDQATLTQLYKVYLTNTAVAINVESAGGVWQPYEKLLKKYAQSLPMAFSFVNIGDIGNYYNSADQFFTFKFYGIKDISFSLTQGGFYGTNSGLFSYVTNASDKVTGIKYNSLLGYSDTVYAKVNMFGNDGTGRGDIGTSAYTELKINFNHKIVVLDGNRERSLENIFPGRSLRTKVMEKVSNLINNTPSSTDKTSIGNGYYYDGEKFYLTNEGLAALDFGTNAIEIDGLYANGQSSLQGLQYTSITNISIIGDAYVGSGDYLVNLTTLQIINSGIDLSAVGRELPNLQTLIIGTLDAGNRYLNMAEGTNYYLNRFTGLTKLHIINSNVYNWEGLRGLIGRDLAELKIYSSASKDKNANNNTAVTAAIVREVYQASTVSAENKYYYIGSTTNAADDTFRYTGVWKDASGITEFSTLAEKEYAEISGHIKDLDFRIGADSNFINSEYFGEHSTGAISNADNTIWLPRGTGNFGYGTQSGLGARTRDFAIEWQAMGINAATAANLFGGDNIASSAATDPVYSLPYSAFKSPTDDYLTLTVNRQADSDYYVMFKGTIGGGYYDEKGAFVPFDLQKNSFIYGVLIKNSTNPALPTATGGRTSFAVFSDTGLRSAVFIAMAACGGINDGGLDSAVASTIDRLEVNNVKAIITKKINSAETSYTITYNDGKFATPYQLKQGCTSIYNIDGIGAFNNLTALQLTGMYLHDISGIVGVKDVIQIVNFESNMLTEVQAFKDCTALKKVLIYKNDIRTIIEDGKTTSVFEKSMATLVELEVYFNKSINAADIWALANTAASSIKLGKVTLMGTRCLDSYEFYNALRALIAKKGTGTTKIQITLADFSVYDVTYEQVNNFITDCEDSAGTIYTYRNTGIDSGNNLVGSIQYAGGTRSYTASYQDANVFGNTRLGLAHLTPIKITSGKIAATFNCYYNTKGAVDKRLQSYPGSGVFAEAADFDPAMWAYLSKKAEDDRTGLTNVINFAANSTPVSISIDKNVGLKSLKGLEKLNNITSITIKGNPLEELGFAAPFTSLKTLNIRDCVFPVGGFAALSQCTGLTALDLANIYGLDYTAVVSGSTTLAKMIVGLAALESVKVSNYVNLDVYSPNSTNIFATLSSIYDNTDKFMGETASPTLTSMAVLSGLYSPGFVKVFSNIDETTLTIKMMANYDGMSKLYYVNNASTSNSLAVINEANNSYQIAIKSALNFTNKNDNTTRDLVPDKIYESNIRTTGVTIDLPVSYTVHNKKYNFDYNVISRNDATDITSQLIKKEVLNGEVVKISIFINSDIYDDLVAKGRVRFYIRTTPIPYSPNKVLEKEIEMIASDKEEIPTINLPTYYLEQADGSWLPASNFIKSGILVNWLFNTYAAQNKGSFVKTNAGICMTYAAIMALETLEITKNAITTLDGIQVFSNLKSLSLDNQAVVTDISALRTLKLTSFKYTNAAGDDGVSAVNNIIMDFTPLLNSKDTLEYFEYSALSNANVDDMSFLMAFGNQIKTIKIYSAQSTAASQASYLNKYLTTNAFKYILAWYEAYRPQCYFYLFAQDINDNELRGHFEWYWRSVSYAPYNELFPKVTSEFKKAAEVFLEMNTQGYDVKYINNYQLVPTNVTSVGDNITFIMPAFINSGGISYPIDWAAMSAYINCIGAKLKANTALTYSFNLPSGNVSYKNGDIIPYSVLKELLNNYVYKNLEFSRQVSIAYEVQIKDINQNVSGMCAIIARINLDSFDYDRIYTIDCSAFKTQPVAPTNSSTAPIHADAVPTTSAPNGLPTPSNIRNGFTYANNKRGAIKNA